MHLIFAMKATILQVDEAATFLERVVWFSYTEFKKKHQKNKGRLNEKQVNARTQGIVTTTAATGNRAALQHWLS